mmetsp:Transcript_11449/g.26859  ORF Transcript_11449/g.26859 Transcript_11449/m.26859 type:complete len:345 (-) Transcript_11449:3032-4066(-)
MISLFSLSSAATLAFSLSFCCFLNTTFDGGSSTLRRASTLDPLLILSLMPRMTNLGKSYTSTSARLRASTALDISFIASTSSSSSASHSSSSSLYRGSDRSSLRSSLVPPLTSVSSSEPLNRAGKTTSSPAGGDFLDNWLHIMAQCLGRRPGDRRTQSPVDSSSPTTSTPSWRRQACRCNDLRLPCSSDGRFPYFSFHEPVTSTSRWVLSARRAAPSSLDLSSSSSMYDLGMMYEPLLPPLFSPPPVPSADHSMLPSPSGSRTLLLGTIGRSKPRSCLIDFLSILMYRSNPTRAAMPLCSVPSRLPAPRISRSRFATSNPLPSSCRSAMACSRCALCSVMKSFL